MYDELSESLTGKSSPAEPTGDAANGAASPIAPAEFVQLIRVVEQLVVRRPVHAFRLYAAPLPSGRGAVALGLRKKTLPAERAQLVSLFESQRHCGVNEANPYVPEHTKMTLDAKGARATTLELIMQTPMLGDCGGSFPS